MRHDAPFSTLRAPFGEESDEARRAVHDIATPIVTEGQHVGRKLAVREG